MGFAGTAGRSVIPYSYPGDQVSPLYRVRINGVDVPVTETPGIAPEDYDGISEAYGQMPAHCWVEPRFVAVHYAYAACDGPAEIVVTVQRRISGAIVRPTRRNIEARLEGNAVRFTVEGPEPRYVMLDIDELPLLCILLDPPEEDASNPGDPGVVDLRTFLADQGDVTGAFQRAVASINGTGGTLLIPPGDYLADTLVLHGVSDCRITLAPGALIRTRTSPPGENIHAHGLWIEDCHNLVIDGRGCIDHQGYENFVCGRNDYAHGLISWAVPSALNPYTTESPVFVHRCSDLRIEGLLVRDARNFNVNLHRSDRVTLRRVKVITPPASVAEFTDGYQVNSCHDTLLENCFAFCNDDCIASGHYFYSHDDRESRNFVARGFVGWNHRANGIRLGFYSHYDLGDFTFEACDIAGPLGPAVLVHPLKDAQEAGRFQRYGAIRLVNCGFSTDRMIHGLLQVDGARIGLLELDDVAFDHQVPGRSMIYGEPNDGIRRFVLRNVTIDGVHLVDPDAAGFDLRGVMSIEVS